MHNFLKQILWTGIAVLGAAAAGGMINESQGNRIQEALHTLM